MVAEGSTATVEWCLEPARQTFDFLPALPAKNTLVVSVIGGGSGDGSRAAVWRKEARRAVRTSRVAGVTAFDRPRAVLIAGLLSLSLVAVVGAADAAQVAPQERRVRACFSTETGKIRVVRSFADCGRGE